MNFTILVLMFGIGTSTITITEIYASSFSYDDQIRYATLSEKMTGHVIASYDTLSKNSSDSKLAQLHLTHPFEEEFDSMNYFYAEHMDFQSNVCCILKLHCVVQEYQELQHILPCLHF